MFYNNQSVSFAVTVIDSVLTTTVVKLSSEMKLDKYRKGVSTRGCSAHTARDTRQYCLRFAPLSTLIQLASVLDRQDALSTVLATFYNQ